MGGTPLQAKVLSEKLLKDPAYREDRGEQFKQAFIACDKNENGILENEEGLTFIKQVMHKLLQEATTEPLTDEECIEVQNAINSLDMHSEGFNLDEFMQTILAISAFNVAGRSPEDTH